MKAVFHMQDGKVHTLIFDAYEGRADTVRSISDMMRKPNSTIIMGSAIVKADCILVAEILDA